MKFLSSFDSNYGQHLEEDMIQRFGKDNVLKLQRGKSYALIHVYIPMLLSFFAGVGVIYVLFYLLQESIILIIISLILILGFIITPFLFNFGRRINYKYDFILVTPVEIIEVDQQGLLERQTNQLKSHSVKSTFIQKSGFLDSIFDCGTIEFSVSSDEYSGSLIMDHVEDIEAKNKKIKQILGL